MVVTVEERCTKRSTAFHSNATKADQASEAQWWLQIKASQFMF